jgi:hypothetical protein
MKEIPNPESLSQNRPNYVFGENYCHFFSDQFFPRQFFLRAIREKLLREELSREEMFEEEFSEVSVSRSVSFISHLENRSAQKLGSFVVQCLSFLFESRYWEDGHIMSTSKSTRNNLLEVFNNFLLVKLLSLARFELGLLASEEIF